MVTSNHPKLMPHLGQGTLRTRLLLTLTAALTPILLFAGLQAYFDGQQSRMDRRAELLQISDSAVDQVEQSLLKAEAVVKLFENDIAQGQCEEVYERAKAALPSLSNVVKSDAVGIAQCNVSAEAGGRLSRDFRSMFERTGLDVVRTEAFKATSTDTWVVAVARQLENETGNFAGTAALSVGIDALSAQTNAINFEGDIEIALADNTGRIFNSIRFDEIDPESIKKADLDEQGELIARETVFAEKVDLVIRRLGNTKLYAVISRPTPGLFSRFSAAPAAAIGVPLLAFSIALLAVWLSLDFLVLKWLRRLRRLAIRYANGEYSADDTKAFHEAPMEFADFAKTMDRMSDEIGTRNASLREAIERRDDAVKEIHHRVKNNLQIVTSYLNLQARQTQDEEAINVLSSARHRIDALSIVHQTLYQHERLDSVEVKPFLENLLSHLKVALGMEDFGIELEQDICVVVRESDDAIPLALFIVEAMTNAMKYAFSEGGGLISVRLKNENEQLVLSIEDNGDGGDASSQNDAKGTGVGSRLMNAFAKQLKGTVERTNQTEGGGYRVVLRMPHGKSA